MKDFLKKLECDLSGIQDQKMLLEAMRLVEKRIQTLETEPMTKCVCQGHQHRHGVAGCYVCDCIYIRGI